MSVKNIDDLVYTTLYNALIKSAGPVAEQPIDVVFTAELNGAKTKEQVDQVEHKYLKNQRGMAVNYIEDMCNKRRSQLGKVNFSDDFNMEDNGPKPCWKCGEQAFSSMCKCKPADGLSCPNCGAPELDPIHPNTLLVRFNKFTDEHENNWSQCLVCSGHTAPVSLEPTGKKSDGGWFSDYQYANDGKDVMARQFLINNLIKIADALDRKGFTRLANIIDETVREVSQPDKKSLLEDKLHDIQLNISEMEVSLAHSNSKNISPETYDKLDKLHRLVAKITANLEKYKK